MTFQPVLPLGGLAGWAFLNRTLASQTEAFSGSAVISRDTAYFEENIAKARTAEDLVSDRRLMRVALGAFGLDGDLDSKAFIRQILEGGTQKTDALATKLADDRYRDFADAFGYGNSDGARTGAKGFATDITARFRRLQFEVAVGDQDQGMRLAMDAKRTMPGIAALDGSDETKWFKVMGNPPLRQFFETALGLPASFAQADLDTQVAEFSARAQRQLGLNSLADLADADKRDSVIERFLLRDQMKAFEVQSAGSIALTLLQSAPRLF